MKVNLPVSNIVREVDPARPLVSETDLKGTITYANDAFVNISQFSREELIGKNHNLVRHPDMPPEAFANLWETLKASKPWRGIVKNRCKNGDLYWVEAYVTPIFQDGVITGYKSVRGSPGKAEVQQAELLYQAIRNKTATLPSHRRNVLQRLSLQWRVNLVLIALLVLLSVSGYLGGLDFSSSVGLVGLGAAIALMASWSLHRSVGVPLKKALDGIGKIAEGNLDHSLRSDGDDEIGQLAVAIESMRIHLRAMIADVFSASAVVENNATEIERLMQQVTETFQVQSDHVNEIGAAMEQMTGSISDVASSTSVAANLSTQVTTLAESGKEQMGVSLNVSRKVEESVLATGERINELHAEIQKIGQITLAIQQIAEQTNLLALNAAIEAARAGEAGRGFAVVADEVRKLAERTSSSTIDITRMVERVSATTDSAVSSMHLAVNNVKQGMEYIHASDGQLQQIVTAAGKANEMTQSSVSAFAKQKTTAEAVTRNMEQIGAMTEQNHRSLESVGRGIHNLAHTAAGLAHLVKRFEKSIKS